MWECIKVYYLEDGELKHRYKARSIDADGAVSESKDFAEKDKAEAWANYMNYLLLSGVVREVSKHWKLSAFRESRIGGK